LRFISLRLISVCSLVLLMMGAATGQEPSLSKTTKLLPKTVGDFRARGAARPVSTLPQEIAPEDFGVRGSAEGAYVSAKGERLTVTVIETQSHAGAYSLLTRTAAEMKGETQGEATMLKGVGVAGYAVPNAILFYKGPVFVSVAGAGKSTDIENILTTFAHAYAQTLPEAENEIPVLIKHLPDWETAQARAIYAISLRTLQEAVGEQPIFEVINFGEGAEAATATYDASRLVVVEYATPQIAAERDAILTARLQELRAQGQPVPSAYRRVGNYSVFVFGAPNEAAAAQLIDRVKYEQSIQWLGENPLLWARAEKQHTRQAVSLILGIARTLGVFLVACVGIGGIFGGLFFLRRRAQQRAAATEEVYTDGGGMLRLNIDELTPETDPARLLGPGEEKPVA
jgi:hypothetical protein